MNRSALIVAILFVATAGCTDPGGFEGDADGGGTDTFESDTTDLPDGGSDTEAGDADDATSPCGGCSGDTPVCDTERETCVECLSNDDCTSEDRSVCDTEVGECVACDPDNEPEWYPDEDGDGFGDGSAGPTTSCDQPDGMVDNAEDCDDDDEDVNPDADEVCNAQDDDCDGENDSNDEIVPAKCDNQMGVCEGATISQCIAAGTDYAVCSDDAYGKHYIDGPNEAMQCDGRDNNCDGEVDEYCCGMDERPSPVQIGSRSSDQANPAIVPAAMGAPDDAAYLAAWSAGKTVVAQHLDPGGNAVGGPMSKELVVSEINGIDLVRRSDKYVVVATSDQGGNGNVQAVVFDASGSSTVPKISVDSNAGATIAGAAAAVKGQTLWVAYTFESGDSGHLVRAAGVDLQNEEVGTGPFDVTAGGDELLNAGAPEIAVVGGTPTVAWWDKAANSVRGARLSSGAVDSRFEVSIGTTNSEFHEPIALLAHGGKAHLLFPDYTSSGESALQYLTVGANETGELSGATALTGDGDTHRQPAAQAVDADGDGMVDKLLVVWGRGSSNDPALVYGRTSIGSPGMMSGRVVKERGSGIVSPELISSDDRAGTIWQQPVVGDSKNIKFVPLSVDGVPICW